MARSGFSPIDSSAADPAFQLNDALFRFDALTIGAVVSDSLLVAPSSPVADSLYIVPPAATGWASQPTGTVAHFYGGSWRYYTPQAGWELKVGKVSKTWDGSSWGATSVSLPNLASDPPAQAGITVLFTRADTFPYVRVPDGTVYPITLGASVPPI